MRKDVTDFIAFDHIHAVDPETVAVSRLNVHRIRWNDLFSGIRIEFTAKDFRAGDHDASLIR